MADFYTWAATGSGNWSTASNWFDVTTGTPPSAAPGASDTAEIDNTGSASIIVTGPADVAGLSVTGQVTLAGSYDIGAFALGGQPIPTPSFSHSMTGTIVLAGTFNATSLSVGGISFNAGFSNTPVIAAGVIEVGSGALLSAGTVALNAGDLQVDGGVVAIGGGLTLGSVIFPEPGSEGFALASGSLDVTHHGSVQLGGLQISEGGVSLDATSTLEIGDAGTATAGTITIDPGAELMEGDNFSYVIQSIHDAETVAVAAPILNNGSIYTDMNLSGVINNGAISASNDALSYISGNGLVEIEHSGTIGPGDSGTFDIEYGGPIVVALGTGVPIDTADTPIIANFAVNDTAQTIVLQGISADTATYTRTGAGIGTLTLNDGASQVASLTLLGGYTGDVFTAVAAGGDTTLTAQTRTGGDSFTWTGGSGDWLSASNWFDVTTGEPAAAAPGSADTAEIDNPGTGTITVTGPASVADLSVSGSVTLAGDYSIGSFVLGVPPGTTGLPVPAPGDPAPTFTSTVALAGSFIADSVTIGFSSFPDQTFQRNVVDYGIVDIEPGATLSAGSVALFSGDLVVDGGAADIAATLQVGTVYFAGESVAGGTLDVLDHAKVQVGRLSLQDGGINLDTTSTLEIGSAGTAAAGTITVDPGAILNGSFNSLGPVSVTISAPILNNGTIIAGFDLSNTINNGAIYLSGGNLSQISGGGQIVLDSNGASIGPNVGGTLDFDLNSGSNVTFAFGSVPIDGEDTPVIGNFGTFTIQYQPGVYSDSILLQGITADSATFEATGTGIGVLTVDSGTNAVASLTLLGTYASDAFSVLVEGGSSLVRLDLPSNGPPPPCFAAGTRIAAPQGEVAVEALRIGDRVSLASGGTAPIVWIGHRRVDCRAHPRPNDVLPVCVSRGAFAPNVPHRDLLLSPDHAVFTEGVLIPVRYLLNGNTIRQVACDAVTYFHIELPAHDVLLAEGLTVESYLDTGDRCNFENAGRVVSLFPVFSAFAWDAYGCAPLVVTGPPVAAARRRIEARARRQDATPRRKRRSAT